MTSLKKTAAYAFAASLFLFLSALYAQDYNDNKKPQDTHEMTPENINEVRPGMELRKVGGINMIVPEGTQFYMEGSQLKMEEAGEYAARRFRQVDERLKAMEEREKKLEEEIKKLQEALKPRHK